MPRAATSAPSVDADAPPKRKGSRYWPWAQRMARTFALDVEKCPKCHGRMKLVALVQDPKRSPASCDTSASRASPPSAPPPERRPTPRPPSCGDSPSATTRPDHAANARVRPRGEIQPQSSRMRAARSSTRAHPKTFRRVREGFSTRPRLAKPRLFRLRSHHVGLHLAIQSAALTWTMLGPSSTGKVGPDACLIVRISTVSTRAWQDPHPQVPRSQ